MYGDFPNLRTFESTARENIICADKSVLAPGDQGFELSFCLGVRNSPIKKIARGGVVRLGID